MCRPGNVVYLIWWERVRTSESLKLSTAYSKNAHDHLKVRKKQTRNSVVVMLFHSMRCPEAKRLQINNQVLLLYSLFSPRGTENHSFFRWTLIVFYYQKDLLIRKRSSETARVRWWPLTLFLFIQQVTVLKRAKSDKKQR